MVLRQEVIDAFTVLGVPSDSEEAFSCRAYKKLALLHHPDRNHGDATSTTRFQEIGAAWNVCQRHYDNPTWSQVPDPSNNRRDGHERFKDRHFSMDEDIPLDPEEEAQFFTFMMFEVFMNRFTHTKGQRYRFQRRGGFGGGVYAFSKSFSESQNNQSANTARQRKESEEYEQRKRDLEREIEAEQRELERVEREKQAMADRRASAQANAFQFGRLGHSAAVRNIIEEFNLDVNASERVLKQKNHQPENYETLLHVAASYCSEELVLYLLDKGASPTALNKANLMPFHVSILSGNEPVVRFFLARRGKLSDGWHPSKAAPDGRTPLDLAIVGKSISLVQLMVKDATVHNVQHCWEQSSSGPIKDVLETKRGFTPYVPSGINNLTSKKGLRKLEEVRKKALRKEEKAKRALEQEERAADNLRRKEQCATEERLEAEARRLAEEENAQQVREKREKENQQRVEREAGQKEEEKAFPRKADVACQKEQEDTRRRVEKGRNHKIEEEPRRRVEHETHRQHLAGRILCSKNEEAEGQGCETDVRLKEMENLGTEEPQKVVSGLGRRGRFGVKRVKATNTQDQEHEREAVQKAEDASHHLPKDGSATDSTTRRRAEQSARDKARHQRLKENSSLMLNSMPSSVTNARKEVILLREDIQTCRIADELFPYETPTVSYGSQY